MPRRSDIHKILILGSGPIVIGQAAEFDYSGVQACKVLREEDFEVVLVNSNPATIMTDPEFADATYIEPLLPGPVAQGLVLAVGEALLGRDGDRVPGVHPHRVDVLDRADDHHVVVAVAHDLELELAPAQHRLVQQHLIDRRDRQAS